MCYWLKCDDFLPYWYRETLIHYIENIDIKSTEKYNNIDWLIDILWYTNMRHNIQNNSVQFNTLGKI